MPNHFDSNIDGYEAISCISDATIAAVLHDMQYSPEDVRQIFQDLSRINEEVTTAVLSQAREAEEDNVGPERAFIIGATFIIRLLEKQGRAAKLNNLLFPVVHPEEARELPEPHISSASSASSAADGAVAGQKPAA